MAHYERQNPEASFDLPDQITVRQQLAYFGAASALPGSADSLIRYWTGAKLLMTNWKCDILPNVDEFDIDTATDPRARDVIVWAGLEVMKAINALEELPKNS